MADTMTMMSPDECFAKAAAALEKGGSHIEIAREWRLLGETIANAKR